MATDKHEARARRAVALALISNARVIGERGNLGIEYGLIAVGRRMMDDDHGWSVLWRLAEQEDAVPEYLNATPEELAGKRSGVDDGSH